MRKIYFVGIKGVGMSSLAIVAKQAGVKVGGCDVHEEFITDSLLEREGIAYDIGFNPENFRKFMGGGKKDEILVVTTGAHGGFENPIVQYAKALEVKVMTQGEAVGSFMSGKLFERDGLEGVSVAGTHGKTTASAMCATYFTKLGWDPSYVVGTSELFPIGSPGHFGRGTYVIAEADEYVSEIAYDRMPKFLYQKPRFAIINNIDFDHPDFYHSLEEVQHAFWKFSQNVRDDGFLIVNGDDKKLLEFKERVGRGKNVISYGTSPHNDFYVSSFRQFGFQSSFRVETKDVVVGDFVLSVPGLHNVKNVMGVVCLLLQLNVAVGTITEILPFFAGTKRRIERMGETKYHSTLIDDYAHHPQEVRVSLATIKRAFPDKKIVCVFQPHTYSRTKIFLDEFVSSFFDASYLILLPVYASLRERKQEELHVEEDIVSKLQVFGKNVTFLKEKDDVVEYIDNTFQSERFVIVTMGAGDVYKVSEALSLRETNSKLNPALAGQKSKAR